MMLQLLRERLAILLLALLPFHALLVTVGTKFIAGPGHAPLTMLALWKEVVLALIVVCAFLEWVKKPNWNIDLIDMLIGALIVLSLVVTAATHNNWVLYAFGFKYDFVPLVAFVALRRVQWSDGFLGRAFTTILWSSIVVSVYAVLSLYLPQSFFTWLGYGDLHSLYTPDGPLAAYQQIEGVPLRRAQSTMSGPNQLGLWQLMPFGIALLQAQPIIGLFAVVAIFLSMSRAAVLAMFVMVAIVVWKRCTPKQIHILALSAVVFGLMGAIGLTQLPSGIVSRATSTAGHIERPLEAIRIIMEHPLGLGLGMAGPASNRVSNTCVHLPEGGDASWAEDRPNLCVFVGGNQVQPEAPCSCPLLPENWYLQIGVEMGIIGFVLFVALIVLVLVRSVYYPELYLPFIGVSLAAVVLHAWEAPAVAYSLWLLLAVVLKPKVT